MGSGSRKPAIIWIRLIQGSLRCAFASLRLGRDGVSKAAMSAVFATADIYRLVHGIRLITYTRGAESLV